MNAHEKRHMVLWWVRNTIFTHNIQNNYNTAWGRCQSYFTLTNNNPIQSENIQTIFGICNADVDLKMKRMIF